MKILLVKMSSLGDVVCNLPVVSDIRAHAPDAEIHWVVEECMTDVPAMHAGVDRVMPIALRRWRKTLVSGATRAELRTFLRALRAHRYDAIIDTQGLVKSAAICLLAHGPSHGQNAATARESLAGRLYAHAYDVPRTLHAVVRNRLVAARALGYAIDDAPADYGVTRITRHGFDWLHGNYIFCLHGTARPSKEWAVENWQRLGKQLAQSRLSLVLAWGSPGEKLHSGRIAAAVPGAIVPPVRLDIPQSAAVIAGARATVGVDTGFLHLAAAIDRPTVGIYTDTDPALSGAYGGRNAAVANVGNIGASPGPDDVLAALVSLGVIVP